jgi:hypothetical protein
MDTLSMLVGIGIGAVVVVCLMAPVVFWMVKVIRGED